MRRSWKAVLWSCFALCLYLTAESFLPAAHQPSSRLGVALLHAYQATGSPAMQACGVQCRYTPTCSHYAADAISHYGTLNGLARTAGRLWRCSPWGGSGYDPAVETHSAAFVAPQQETPEEKKVREEKDLEKLQKEFPKEAGAAAAACGLGCAAVIASAVLGTAILVFMMVFTYKDAKARGDQNAVLWLVLIFFVHLIGFVVYMVARPKGELVPCPSCHQKKLETLVKCPHCGTDTGATAKPPPPA